VSYRGLREGQGADRIVGPKVPTELQCSIAAIHLAHTRHENHLCEQQWTKRELHLTPFKMQC